MKRLDKLNNALALLRNMDNPNFAYRAPSYICEPLKTELPLSVTAQREAEKQELKRKNSGLLKAMRQGYLSYLD